jgi:hypothetical protein
VSQSRTMVPIDALQAASMAVPMARQQTYRILSASRSLTLCKSPPSTLPPARWLSVTLPAAQGPREVVSPCERTNAPRSPARMAAHSSTDNARNSFGWQCAGPRLVQPTSQVRVRAGSSPLRERQRKPAAWNPRSSPRQPEKNDR